MAINYYDIKPLLDTKAQYLMLLGERANGKSYQCKLTVLNHAYKNGRKFIYLRRWQADITAKGVESYFADMDIKKITKGKFNCISCYAGFIYFGILDKEGKVKRAQEIGRYLDLNEQQRYKSQSFPDYDYIIFEEFISTGLYLTDEARELTSLISTVARHRQITVMMVGNTISRLCPYFTEWSLDGILKQNPGTIDIYHWHTDDGDIDIAVEYCRSAGASNKMYYGNTQKSSVGVEWDTYNYPQPKKHGDFDLLYEVVMQHDKHKFMIQLMYDNDEDCTFVFVYPCNSDRMTERVISNQHSLNPLWSIDFDVECKPVQMIWHLIQCKKVCYSDNLTGTEFNAILEMMGVM